MVPPTHRITFSMADTMNHAGNKFLAHRMIMIIGWLNTGTMLLLMLHTLACRGVVKFAPWLAEGLSVVRTELRSNAHPVTTIFWDSNP